MSLTVAICTRHRPDSLRRCLESLVKTERPNTPVEVLIIDDGDTPLDSEALHPLIERQGYAFRALHNAGPHGLIHGRVLAVREATGDILLFLDDDVEVDPSYLVKLVETYARHPEVAAVGGVDLLLRGKGGLVRFYRRVFLLESKVLGQLTPSGFNGSQNHWSVAKEPFTTEFLSGCNMSFRRNALRHLQAPKWLEHNSLTEDILLPDEARKTGGVIVDPALKVKHHRDPESRLSATRTAYITIRNTSLLLGVRRSPGGRYLALLWTTIGLILKDLARPSRWPLVPAYLKAMRHVFGDWVRATLTPESPDRPEALHR